MRQTRWFLAFSALLVAFFAQASAVSVVGERVIEHEAVPGQVIHGIIPVFNHGPTSEGVRLYVTDYTTELPQEHVVVDAGSLEYSSAPWMRLPADEAIVVGESGTNLDYRLELPPDVMDGAYWAVVMVEDARTQPLGVTSGDAAVQLQHRQRIAVRVVVHVRSNRQPVVGQVTFEGTVVALHDGRHAMSSDVRNTGRQMLVLHPRVRLFDVAGVNIGEFDGPSATLLPGASWRYHVELDRLPQGEYMAVLLTEDRAGAVFGAQQRLQIR